ncbi:MAG TPA: LegC family aminotransferase [Bacteroidales bacterium]|nr:LegC family aminotransferase [Bacteroidales bacterium]
MERNREILSFIRNIYQNVDGNIPLHGPVFNGNEMKYLEECIDTTFVSSAGKFVDRFETEIARYTGAAKAVACVNGTNALHLALILAGVKDGDEVITQPLTFVSTANSIKYCSAFPIFLDVDKDTLGLSPESLSNFLEIMTRQESGKCINKLTSRKITACVPMHTFGHPCRIDEIVVVCKKHNIIVVEDAAESMGSIYKGKHTGTYGDIGVFSFNGNKILTTGGGGMLLFNDLEKAKHAKHLTTQAKVIHPWEYFHDEVGYNYRMPNINAALGLAQLEQLDNFLNIKRRIAQEYNNFFRSIDIQFVGEPQNSRSNYWLNSIIFENKEFRDSFLKFSNENGVMTRPAWELMHRLPMYKNVQRGDLTKAEWISDRLVNIPSSVIQRK